MPDLPPQLSEDEIKEKVAQCAPAQRVPFEGWLRGTHHLDGERIEPKDGEQA